MTKACLPYLKKSAADPHVLTLSPPLNLHPKWFRDHAAYTISKFDMSMLTLGWAEEFREEGIAFNPLWPRTMIATATVQNLLGGEEAMARSRTPEIIADAAYAILTRSSRECTGNFLHRRGGVRRGGRHRPRTLPRRLGGRRTRHGLVPGLSTAGCLPRLRWTDREKE